MGNPGTSTSASSGHPEEGRRAPLKRILLEIGFLYALVVGIELILTGGRVGALGVHPHPYWIVILPMAASRGTVAGMLAALVGASLEVLGLHQAGLLDMSQLLDLQPFGQGVLFFGVAFLIGELADSHARKFKELGSKLEAERETTDRLRHERNVLDAATHHLRRIVQERPMLRGRLLEIAVRMETTDRESVAATILDLVAEQCHASMASIWVVDMDSRLHLMRSVGWRGTDEAPRIQAMRESEIVRQAVETATPINRLQPGELPSRNEPVLLAPLSDGRGMLWGVLCLDDIEPVYLGTETEQIFLSLAAWATAVLMRIDNGVVAPSTPDVGAPNALGERLWLEYDRAARYGDSLRILGLQVLSDISDPPENEDEAEAAIVGSLSEAGWKACAYKFGYPGCFAVVAPARSEADIEVVQRAAMVEAAGRGVTLASFVVALDGDTPDLDSLLEASAAQFRSKTSLPLAATPPVRIPSVLRVGNAGELIERLTLELDLSERTGRPLQTIVLHPAATDERARRAFALDAARATDALRPMDGLYALPDGRIALVFPSTDTNGAAVTVERFLEVLRERNPGAPYSPVRVQSTEPLCLLKEVA